MHIAIKCPAPIGPNLTKWGDYPFAQALARALEARGARVSLHFWPEWDKDEGEDAVLVLRGKRRYEPRPDKLSALWVMSHPATVSSDEIDAYTIAFVASETHARFLDGATTTPVAVMRQCTDPHLFAPPLSFDNDVSKRRDIIFVANSRGVRRDIVQLAAESGAPFKIIGRHWRNTGLNHLVTREFIDNNDLPALYRASRLSLNDHWGDMMHFGYINNRIFDCLSCGLPLLTDVFPELREVCGDDLLYAWDRESFSASAQRYSLAYPDVMDRAQSLWARLRDEYTFDRRAEQILDGFARPRIGVAAPRTRAQAGQADGVLAALIAAAEARSVALPFQLLHVNPTADATYALSARDEASYLSAGFGIGPWHVALPLDAAPLLEGVFDAIVLEADAPIRHLPATERALFIAALLRRIRARGWVAAHESFEAEMFTDFAPAEAALPAGWRLFVRG